MDTPTRARLTALRRELHTVPELSGREEVTAACIREFLVACEPVRLLESLGGHGLAAVFASPDDRDGPTVVLRAELDGLPIHETSGVPHASRREGCAHACGHDGHMAVLAGVALSLRQRPLQRGRVVLLFQPAEETGQGARAVIADPRWQQLNPDHCYAVHNLPGYPLGQVLIREGAFTAGSVGLQIRLEGRTAHAAYPEQGLSPAAALSRLVPGLTSLPARLTLPTDLALVTVVHARLGEVTFGTSPGEASIMGTLRADSEETLALLRRQAAALAQREAAAHDLTCRLSWVEEFPVTTNDDLAVSVVRIAAARCGLPAAEPMESPFRWSEDFGWYTRDVTGALIGLGAGEHHPVLHAPDFDFPDDLIPIGTDLLEAVLDEIGLR